MFFTRKKAGKMAKPMITVEEARERVVALASEPRFKMPVENVPLLDALGRVVASDLVSDIDVAPFDNSAMDGFAVVASSLEGATPENPVTLDIIDWIGAGAVSEKTVQPGQAIRIMTGAIMPDGADAVVRIEDVQLAGEGLVGDSVSFSAPVAVGRHVRYAGGEAEAGSVVLSAGEVVRAATLGLLASTGNMEVPVYSAPKVGIISIGTELVPAPEIPGPGKIRDSNSYAISGYVRELGGIPVKYPLVVDDEAAIRDTILRAADECDYIVTTGGACDGDFDYAIAIVKELGEVLFDLVSLRPGKAQALGYIGNTMVHVLSGNPAAAAVGFELFSRPALRIIQGFSAAKRPVSLAVMADSTKKKEGRAFYQRGHLAYGENGQLLAEQERAQNSALLSEMHRSSVLIRLPEGEGAYESGAPVECMHLDIDEGVII